MPDDGLQNRVRPRNTQSGLVRSDMARSIGEIVRPIISQAIQRVEIDPDLRADLASQPLAENRKASIMKAWERGAISGDMCTLLIQVFMLETA